MRSMILRSALSGCALVTLAGCEPGFPEAAIGDAHATMRFDDAGRHTTGSFTVRYTLTNGSFSGFAPRLQVSRTNGGDLVADGAAIEAHDALPSDLSAGDDVVVHYTFRVDEPSKAVPVRLCRPLGSTREEAGLTVKVSWERPHRLFDDMTHEDGSSAFGDVTLDTAADELPAPITAGASSGVALGLSEAELVTSAAVDPAGGALVAATPVEPDGSGKPALVTRFDAAGTRVGSWSSDLAGVAVATQGDRTRLAGGRGDATVVEARDAAGALAWSTPLARSAGALVTALALAADGTTFVAASFLHATDEAAFPTPEDEHGAFLVGLDATGAQAFRVPFRTLGAAVAATSTGHAIVVGEGPSADGAKRPLAVTSYGPDGAVDWTTPLGALPRPVVASIALDEHDAAFVAYGASSVAKLDASGAIAWKAEATGTVLVDGIAVLGPDSIAVSGSAQVDAVSPFGAANTRTLIRLDGAGRRRSEATLGCGDSGGTSTLASRAGVPGAFLATAFRGQIAADRGGALAPRGDDVFVAKLEP